MSIAKRGGGWELLSSLRLSLVTSHDDASREIWNSRTINVSFLTARPHPPCLVLRRSHTIWRRVIDLLMDDAVVVLSNAESQPLLSRKPSSDWTTYLQQVISQHRHCHNPVSEMADPWGTGSAKRMATYGDGTLRRPMAIYGFSHITFCTRCIQFRDTGNKKPVGI